MLRSYAISPAVVSIAIIASAAGACADPPRPCSQDEITLLTLSWTDAQQVIAKHKGNVVLVDVWTTTCPTCLEHFPKFVDLNQRLRSRGLIAVSINCDYDGIPAKPPAHYAPRVLKFLQDQQARLTH